MAYVVFKEKIKFWGEVTNDLWAFALLLWKARLFKYLRILSMTCNSLQWAEMKKKFFEVLHKFELKCMASTRLIREYNSGIHTRRNKWELKIDF